MDAGQQPTLCTFQALVPQHNVCGNRGQGPSWENVPRPLLFHPVALATLWLLGNTTLEQRFDPQGLDHERCKANQHGSSSTVKQINLSSGVYLIAQHGG